LKVLEGLSNPITGPDSERAADKRKEDAAKREDVATPQYRDVASDVDPMKRPIQHSFFVSIRSGMQSTIPARLLPDV
jgi:hypothetical protein